MDLGNIAELNTFDVLDTIRSQGPVTRSELAHDLGLSDASVSRIVKRLLASGSIEELPGAPAARGRTPSKLRFVGSVGAVIAVDLGGTRCHGALSDLAGVIIEEDSRPARDGKDAAAALLSCVGALTLRAAELGVPVHATVVGIPALIDPATGLATAGPNVDWHGFDLIGVLRENLPGPFEVDNDVNLGALGQAWRGAGRGIDSFVVISLGTGIGGAVVIDGRLIGGRHNAAGEVGYLPVRRSGPGQPAPSGFEDVASGSALRARANELVAAAAATSLSGRAFDVADIFTLAAADDQVAARVVSELIADVAAAIAGITAVVDPERIILDGSVGQALAPWLDDLRALVAGLVFRSPDIVVSDLGSNATIIGAIARALAIASAADLRARPRAAVNTRVR